jgi:hypothetical protein
VRHLAWERIHVSSNISLPASCVLAQKVFRQTKPEAGSTRNPSENEHALRPFPAKDMRNGQRKTLYMPRVSALLLPTLPPEAAARPRPDVPSPDPERNIDEFQSAGCRRTERVRVRKGFIRAMTVQIPILQRATTKLGSRGGQKAPSRECVLSYCWVPLRLLESRYSFASGSSEEGWKPPHWKHSGTLPYLRPLAVASQRYRRCSCCFSQPEGAISISTSHRVLVVLAYGGVSFFPLV